MILSFKDLNKEMQKFILNAFLSNKESQGWIWDPKKNKNLYDVGVKNKLINRKSFKLIINYD